MSANRDRCEAKTAKGERCSFNAFDFSYVYNVSLCGTHLCCACRESLRLPIGQWAWMEEEGIWVDMIEGGEA